jgi:hypothetical protein
MKETRHCSLARRLSLPWALVLLLQAAGPVANAAPQAGATEDGRKKLVARFVKAIQSSDRNELIELVHPAVRACMKPKTQAYFDFVLRPKVNAPLPIDPSGNNLRITFRNVDPADARKTRDAPALFYYPVQPTHQFQLDIKTSQLNAITIVRQIAPLDGVWFIVAPCPTQEGLEAFQRKSQARGRQVEDAARRAAGLRDPLLSEIRLLLKQRKRMAAIERYRTAANVDLTTAVDVINVVERAQKDSSGR